MFGIDKRRQTKTPVPPAEPAVADVAEEPTSLPPTAGAATHVINISGGVIADPTATLASLEALPNDLTGQRVHLDAQYTVFFGPRLAEACISEVCVRRSGTLVVTGVDDSAGQRFMHLAFRAGVAARVVVADTAPTAMVLRRNLQRELLAHNPPATS